MDAYEKKTLADIMYFLNWGVSQNVPIAMGELGATKNDDTTKFNQLIDNLLVRMDQANMPVFSWVTSKAYGPGSGGLVYGEHAGSSLGVLDTVYPTSAPFKAHAQTPNYLRGTNFSGAEFESNVTCNSNPGVAGTDYFLHGLGDFQFAYAQGERTARLPFRLERLIDISGGPDQPLNATRSAELVAMINAAAAAGINVVPEMHNFMRIFYQDGGTRRELKFRYAPGLDLPNNRVGIEYLVNAWRRIHTLLAPLPNVIGYGLMNEPHDMDAGRAGKFAVIKPEADADRAQAKANGSNHVVLFAYWDRLQTSAGGALVGSEVTILRGWIDNAIANGLKVILEPAVQYPPTFVKTNVQKFKKQDGTEWTSGTPGEDIRDWVWTQLGRTYLHDFISKLLAALDLNKIARFRVGMGLFGEHQGPRSGSAPFAFWGYGAAEQSGTDLATGMTQCPVAVRTPFVPYAGGTSDANNLAWAEWWLEGWKTFLLWCIAELRNAGWNGKMQVLHPSWGLRSNATPAQDVYREAIAQAQDWGRFMTAYHAIEPSLVRAYCTWIDGVDPGDPNTPDGQAAWRYMYGLAAARGMQDDMWGENTGGQNNTDMNRVIQTGAMANGYEGLAWLEHASLASGSDDTYANWLARIIEYDTTGTGSGAFSGTLRYDWEDTNQGWGAGGGDPNIAVVRSTAQVHDGVASLRITRSAGSVSTGYTNIRADDGALLRGGSLSGNTIHFWARLGAGTAGGWRIRAEWQDAGFVWQYGPFVDLTAGTWVECTCTFPAGINSPRAFGIQAEANDAVAGTAVDIWIDSFGQGSTASGTNLRNEDRQLESMLQEVVDGLRNFGCTERLYIPGNGWQSARYWQDHHPVKFIIDPINNIVYEAHYYPDPDGSGSFDQPSESYAAGEADALFRGFTDDTSEPGGGGGEEPPPPGPGSGGTGGGGVIPPGGLAIGVGCFIGTPEFWIYITPDGVEFPLHAPNVRVVISDDGTGIPPIEYVTQRGPRQHGESLVNFFLKPRILQLMLRAQNISRNAYWDSRLGILNMVRPNRQPSVGALSTGRLRKIMSTGAMLDLDCLIQSGPNFNPRDIKKWDEWAWQEVLRFIAFNPVAYDPTERAITYDPFTGGQIVFPITFPITFTPASGDQNVTYYGTWPEYPRFTLTGPLSNPIIENLTTGERLQLNTVLAAGQTATIDLSYSRKTIIRNDGVNLVGFLSADSDLGDFHLEPEPIATGGVNQLHIQAGGGGGGSGVVMRYNDRYIGF